MRQRITPGQLDDLNDAQKEKLRAWWEPKAGDLGYFYYDQYAFLASCVSRNEFKKWCKENLNIINKYQFTVIKDGTFYSYENNFIEGRTGDEQVMINKRFCLPIECDGLCEFIDALPFKETEIKDKNSFEDGLRSWIGFVQRRMGNR